MDTRKTLGLLSLLLVCSCASIERRAARMEVLDPRDIRELAFEEVTDDPKLPRVLLIGDSISIGYTAYVRKLLEGVVNVHRVPENAGPTTRGLEKLSEWLGDGKWDVIHFNWGLHDLKFMEAGDRQVSLEGYEENVRQLVAAMETTGARLIWASTTPVPEGVMGPKRIPQDVIDYNAAAQRVMDNRSVAINDLYSFALPRLGEIQIHLNVHFTSEGSRELGVQVAKAIQKALR